MSEFGTPQFSRVGRRQRRRVCRLRTGSPWHKLYIENIFARGFGRTAERRSWQARVNCWQITSTDKLCFCEEIQHVLCLHVP
jgi:hypothetical protein